LGNLLIDYFSGQQEDFPSIPVDLSYTTDFGRSVLKELQKIPYGCVVGYGELAEMVGRPRAARAVGTVVGHNRTPVVIPCHRVIAADRKIGGFSAGLDWKYRLLDIEGIQI
jgi:methylated-DNA-[protein]-cysteine S-methyltransferase